MGWKQLASSNEGIKHSNTLYQIMLSDTDTAVDQTYMIYLQLHGKIMLKFFILIILGLDVINLKNGGKQGRVLHIALNQLFTVHKYTEGSRDY